MSNEAQNEKIRQALDLLDHANDEHWTEDGLPRLGIVQRLAADGSFKRADMVEARPGFVRKISVANAPPVPSAPPAPTPPVDESDPPEMTADGAAVDPTAVASVESESEFVTEEEAREILTDNVHAAEEALHDAQRDLLQGQERVTAAMKGVTQARADLSRKFPPLTPAENIRQFIDSENQKRAAAVGQGHVYAQIDQAMQRGNSRGWARPTRFAGARQTRAVR